MDLLTRPFTLPPAPPRRFNRNWRYHKDLRVWLTKESGTAPSQKVAGGEQGVYTFWDPDGWAKERKEMTVLYAELEEKATPAPQAYAAAPPPAVGGQIAVGAQVAVGMGQVQRFGVAAM